MITLQFVTEKWSLASWGIRYGTWCSISHVDLVLPGGLLLGARTDHVAGVQVRPASYAPFTRIIQVDFDFTEEQSEKYTEWCKSQIGKPYDQRGIVGYFIHGKDRDWRDEHAWFCSELHARASEIAGRPFLDFAFIGCFKIDPRDLLLSDHKLATRYIL